VPSENDDGEADEKDRPTRRSDAGGLHASREGERRGDAEHGRDDDDDDAATVKSRATMVHPTPKSNAPLRGPEHCEHHEEGVLRSEVGIRQRSHSKNYFRPIRGAPSVIYALLLDVTQTGVVEDARDHFFGR